MADDQLHDIVQGLRDRLSADLETQISLLKERNQQAVDAARKAAEAEAEQRWSARLETARAEADARVASEAQRVKTEVEQMCAETLARSQRDHDPRAWDDAAQRLRERLRESGPLRRAEVDELLGKEFGRGIHAVVPLVRVPPSGTWERRRADLYGDAQEWLGPPPDALTAEDGLELLVRRYLGGFGPSTTKEIAGFAGLQAGEVAPALERLSLRRFRAEDGAELLDLPRLPIADGDAPAPPRFLPVWDATLLVHARRTQVLREEDRPRVFNSRTPHSFNTFLVDGEVAGTWRIEDGRVEVEAFRRLERSARAELREEGERLAAFCA